MFKQEGKVQNKTLLEEETCEAGGRETNKQQGDILNNYVIKKDTLESGDVGEDWNKENMRSNSEVQLLQQHKEIRYITGQKYINNNKGLIRLE